MTQNWALTQFSATRCLCALFESKDSSDEESAASSKDSSPKHEGDEDEDENEDTTSTTKAPAQNSRNNCKYLYL